MTETMLHSTSRQARADALSKLAERWIAPPATSSLATAYDALIAQDGLGATSNRAIPVESLYEPWTADEAASPAIGRRTGYLRGDAAARLSEILAGAGLSTPSWLTLEPDHIAILLEVSALLAAYAPAVEQEAFFADHFSWLDEYAELAVTRWSRRALPEAITDEDAAAYRALLDETRDAVAFARLAGVDQGDASYNGLLVARDAGETREFFSRGIGTFAAWRERAFARPAVASITTCGGCINGCALRVHARNGRIIRVEGAKDDPISQGSLCAKGALYHDIAYTPTGRITAPAKRLPDGSYRYISWDQAISEIAAKLHAIVGESGPQVVALNHGVSAFQAPFAYRFFQALGTPNMTQVTGACKPSLDLAWNATAGAWMQLDFANANYVVFIGRSYADGVIPPLLAGLKAKRKAGLGHYIVVDPRKNATVRYADEWLAIRPGTDLAFILALSNVVVEEGLYDRDFVEAHTVGFGEYAQALGEYTPEWAQGITDIPAATIRRIARELATIEGAAVEQGFRGGLGNTYANNIQTVRALALLNGLIGAYGKPGTLQVPPTPGAPVGQPDASRFPAPPAAEGGIYDFAEHPYLNPDDITSSLYLGAEKGDIRAIFYYATNPVLAHGNPQVVVEKLRHLDLLVTIDIRWSETAGVSDYVLPDVTFLEQDCGVKVAAGVGLAAYDDRAAIAPVHPGTRGADAIFKALAKAYGVGDAVAFDVGDLRRAALNDLGLSASQLADGAIVRLDAPAAGADAGESAPDSPAFAFPNATGKLEFASDAFAGLGLGRMPSWQPPAVEPEPGQFRLIAGNSDLFAHTYSTLSPAVLKQTVEKGYDRVWINDGAAAELGILEGDAIELVSERATTPAIAHVTPDVHPRTLYVSSSLGAKQPELGDAVGVGVAFLDHAPGVYDPNSLASWTQENAITVRKAS